MILTCFDALKLATLRSILKAEINRFLSIFSASTHAMLCASEVNIAPRKLNEVYFFHFLITAAVIKNQSRWELQKHLTCQMAHNLSNGTYS